MARNTTRGTVRIINREGYRIMNDLVLNQNQKVVKIGYPENGTLGGAEQTGSGHELSTTISEIAQIALDNEMGTDTIPSRPFFSSAFDNNIEPLKNMALRLYRQIARGHLTLDQGLSALGEFMIVKTKQSLLTGPWQANAEETILAKDSDKPLVDRSQLLNSITSKIVGRRENVTL